MASRTDYVDRFNSAPPPPASFFAHPSFPTGQNVSALIGITYSLHNTSIVLAGGGGCVDTGVSSKFVLPASYYRKAPFPDAGTAYSGAPVVISAISTLAAHVLANGSANGTAYSAFNRTASAMGIQAQTPLLAGDLST